MSTTVNRSDPACGTCRKKSRKCDRGRPVCQRCITKGLKCEGYETKFKVYNIATGPKKRRTRDRNGVDTRRQSTRMLTRNRDNRTPPVSVFPPQPPTSKPHTSSTDHHSSYYNDSLSSSPRLNDILSAENNQKLLIHFEDVVCNVLTTLPSSTPNPFEEFILPLAHQHTTLLHAILGLSACHISVADFPERETSAIKHKLAAIQALSTFLVKEEVLGLTEPEEDVTLATVLLLILQDIFESGISSHGTHLNGVAFLCTKITGCHRESQTKLRTFLQASLSWLDLLRGISGAEKLAFPAVVRDYVLNAEDCSLEIVTGCPTDVFHALGRVLAAAKTWMDTDTTIEQFKHILDEEEQRLRQLDMLQLKFPTHDPSWPLLADAYRHAGLLRVMRFPDAFVTPCDEPTIKASVDRIFDICSLIPIESPLYRRLSFPLFMAAADTDSKHQQHYATMIIGLIRDSTGIMQPAMPDLLRKVWEARESSEDANVPWMEFTCSKHLKRQHDYLFL